MATEVIKLTGTVNWARLYQPDTAFNREVYKLNFHPENEAEWKKIEAAGIQKKPREDANGKFIILERPAYKIMKGAVVHFTGPVVLDKDNGVIVDYISKLTGKRVYSYDAKKKDDVERRGNPILVGNGSKVELTVAVYDTMKGKGHRLETVKVLDLIEYTGGDLPPLSTMVTEREEIVEQQKEIKEEKKEKLPW